VLLGYFLLFSEYSLLKYRPSSLAISGVLCAFKCLGASPDAWIECMRRLGILASGNDIERCQLEVARIHYHSNKNDFKLFY
jgi:hypothetical protein